MISKVYNYVNSVPHIPIWLVELFKISSVKILVTLTTTQVETLFGELEYLEPRLEALGVTLAGEEADRV
jgi:hypothetical protein